MQPHRLSIRMCAALWGVIFAPLAPVLANDGSYADRLPADTIAVVSWQHLAAKESLDLRLIDEMLENAPPTINLPDAPPIDTNLLRRVVRAANHPTALALLDLGIRDNAPDVQFVMLIQAGDDAPPLADALHDFFVQMGAAATLAAVDDANLRKLSPPNANFSIYWGVYREYFIASISQTAIQRVLPLLRGEPQPTLARSAAFRTCRAAINNTEAELGELFIDLTRAKDQLLELAEAMGDPPPPDFERTLDKLGILNLEALYFCGANGDNGPESHFYLHLPKGLKGYWSLYDQQPLTPSDLALIPADAYFGSVWNLNLAQLAQTALNIVEDFDPDARAQIEGGLAAAGGFVGLSITNQILPAFGDTWAVYDARSHGALPGAGSVLIAQMSEPELFPALMERLANIITSFGAQERPPVTVTVKQTQRDNRTINYLSITGGPIPVAPAWTFVNDRLVLGLWPQAVITAAKHIDVRSRRAALVNDPNPRDLIAAKLPNEMIAFTYLDTELFLRALYPFMLGVNTAGMSAIASEGLDLGNVLYPTLDELLNKTYPSFGAAARTEHGLVSTNVGSLGNPALVAALVGLAVGIALPSVSRARMQAKRTVSAMNLRMIGVCCHIYANENQNEFPADFDTMLEYECITRDSLTAPNDPTGGISYVYIAGQTANDDPRNIVAYEKPLSADGACALFLDGHVEFLRPGEFEQMLRATFQRLDREDEMPNIAWPSSSVW